MSAFIDYCRRSTELPPPSGIEQPNYAVLMVACFEYDPAPIFLLQVCAFA